MAKVALGTTREATQPDCIKALIVEFITTFLFVFAGVGSAMAAGISFFILLFFFMIDA
jgi:aquaporin TIP